MNMNGIKVFGFRLQNNRLHYTVQLQNMRTRRQEYRQLPKRCVCYIHFTQRTMYKKLIVPTHHTITGICVRKTLHWDFFHILATTLVCLLGECCLYWGSKPEVSQPEMEKLSLEICQPNWNICITKKVNSIYLDGAICFRESKFTATVLVKLWRNFRFNFVIKLRQETSPGFMVKHGETTLVSAST